MALSCQDVHAQGAFDAWVVVALHAAGGVHADDLLHPGQVVAADLRRQGHADAYVFQYTSLAKRKTWDTQPGGNCILGVEKNGKRLNPADRAVRVLRKWVDVKLRRSES